MHHAHVCLLPAEILREIFTTIHEDRSRRVRDSRATIAVLARTCRAFKDPALDVLWKHINGLKPLFSCFPKGVVTKKGKLSLTRPLVDREWKILGQYARRIHSWTFRSPTLDLMSERVVQALISAPSFAVLPNLRTLEWFDDRDCFFPLLHTLLVPTITSLTLGCTPSEPWDPSFVKSALLGSLVARCPSIQKLVCAYRAGSEMSSDAVSAAICGWRNLVHLETGVINAQALVHLASLPSLKSLHFRSSDHINGTLPTSIPSFISNLDQVCIAAPSHSHLAQCLRNVRFLSCRSVVISIYHDLEPYHPDIPDLIVSFSKCFSSALEELHVRLRFDLSNLDVDEPDNHRLALGFDVIAPLLPFSRLTKLDLDWFCPLNVDDKGLKDMVQCWPQLEEFYFGVSTAMLVLPSVTFIGLVYLIQHCRHLRTIHMSFHACPIDIDCEPFSKTIPNMKVTYLGVGDSPIFDPIVVACQLHMLLPNLTMISHGLWDREPMPPSIVALNDEWDRADEYLQVLTKGAEMREKMGPLPEECLPIVR